MGAFLNISKYKILTFYHLSRILIFKLHVCKVEIKYVLIKYHSKY